MKKAFTKDELAMISNQLYCPSGDEGLEIARLLNETNASMINNTIDLLQIKSGDHVLELGPGNAAHLSEIMDRQSDLCYTALEISQTMVEESMRINQNYVQNSNAQFILYDGIYFPKGIEPANHILSVNNLYFWENPEVLMHEIYKGLKPGGSFTLAYGQKRYMEKNDFVGQEFRLYDRQDVEALMDKTAFRMQSHQDFTENIVRTTGESVTRDYSIALMQKE